LEPTLRQNLIAFNFKKSFSEMDTFSFPALGWNKFFEDQIAEITLKDFKTGRVTAENKTNYNLLSDTGEYIAEVTGKLLYTISSTAELPKVGDWVIFTEMDAGRAIIHQVLRRHTVLSRKAVGKDMTEQIVVTNLDVLFIVQGLDQNFNISRIERYLSALQGIEAVIVLNKSDCCEDKDQKIAEVSERLPKIKIISTSCVNGDIGALRECIQHGKTYAFAGSSGVGKSSLINSLIKKETQRTLETREIDGKGRHTTTRREMIVMDDGGLLIDTPGMREFQPWAAEGDLSTAFDDIEELAMQCRYADCTHLREDHCAVKEALESGVLNETHYQNYLKLKREMNYQRSLTDPLYARARKKENKKIHRAANKIFRKEPGERE
jgi:ribosome biogenesis GTPase